MTWEETQAHWRQWFDDRGWVGVTMLIGCFYLDRRERGDAIYLSDEGVSASKLVWLIQNDYAEPIPIAGSA